MGIICITERRTTALMSQSVEERQSTESASLKVTLEFIDLSHFPACSKIISSSGSSWVPDLDQSNYVPEKKSLQIKRKLNVTGQSWRLSRSAEAFYSEARDTLTIPDGRSKARLDVDSQINDPSIMLDRERTVGTHAAFEDTRETILKSITESPLVPSPDLAKLKERQEERDNYLNVLDRSKKLIHNVLGKQGNILEDLPVISESISRKDPQLRRRICEFLRRIRYTIA
eukprot:TRINITY_DN3766_c0_g1_i1.p2 TRINITY_DN3766_c0_g1~~TRINITY_DN3766_c0_g1_i1.p2  ORF type:complete len:229 (-),score=35.84 TRINITY_DN3766_c0_g1_i1:473-1159(-)